MLWSRYKYGNAIAVCLSALLVFIAVLEINFALAWVCFVPLFMVLQNSNNRNIKSSLLFGATLSLVSFYWMIPGAQRFTGSGVVYGIVVFIVSTLILTLYWMVLFALFSFLQRPIKKKSDVFINAVAAGALWVLGEALMALVSLQMPWFLFRTGIAVSANLYAIQPVAFLGVSIATFFIVTVNYLIAGCLDAKNYKSLWIPTVVFAGYMLAGDFILQGFTAQKSNLKAIKAAVLTENIPAEMRWDDANGNALVSRLLGLAKASAQLQPDIAVWSESTVPWTYRPDDDFVKEILTINNGRNITQILGINSDYDSSTVYNSVYSILPNGTVTSRYDKRYLLGFIEQPVAGIIFPFLSTGGYVVASGSSGRPLQTPFGKAGILICNESTVSSAAADMVKNGAQFILNMSNDGWFADTYIAGQHFYNARLRAVETRKDLVVNSNDGLTGLIRASGEIVSAKRSDKPNTEMVMIQPNNAIPLAATSPYIVLYACGAFILFLVAIRRQRA